MNQLSWKQRPFRNTIELISENRNVGKIITQSLLRQQTGEINGKKYNFICRGLLFNKVQILNSLDKSFVGEIKYQYLSNRGLINLNSGEKFFWRFSYTNSK